MEISQALSWQPSAAAASVPDWACPAGSFSMLRKTKSVLNRLGSSANLVTHPKEAVVVWYNELFATYLCCWCLGLSQLSANVSTFFSVLLRQCYTLLVTWPKAIKSPYLFHSSRHSCLVTFLSLWSPRYHHCWCMMSLLMYNLSRPVSLSSCLSFSSV